VTPEIPSAYLAAPARKIDLSDDAPVLQLRRPFRHLADELVSGDTAKIHVAFENLQVGGADSGETDANQSALI
jgi:hypothetical protein